MINIAGQRDWFEFILDFNLLDKHLLVENASNPDPSGSSLIIQFLYHANMTEQMYNNITSSNQPANAPNPAGSLSPSTGNNNPLVGSNTASPPSSPAVAAKPDDVTIISQSQVELKVKRIKVLRILAIKTASILGWNLLKFEKEIPIAVMSDLLHIFLRLTMNDTELKSHSQLELEKLDKQTLFALQLLHRWCLRAVIFSKFPKKPPTKSLNINMPGSLNPLQHMKDANDNILKVITNNVQETVEFLERFVNTCTTSDVFKPTSACFKDLNAETGLYELVWDNSEQINIDYIKNIIQYDLGIYFFQQEEYEKSFGYFKTFEEFKLKLDSSNDKILAELNVYSDELDSYLLVCKSMFNMSTEPESIINTKIIDNHVKKSIHKVYTVEDFLAKSNYKGLFECLMDDNKTPHLSTSFRLSLESQLNGSSAPQLVDQILCSNLVKIIVDLTLLPFDNYKLDQLKCLPQVVNMSLETLPANFKSNLISWVHLNMKKFNPQCRAELLKSVRLLNVGHSAVSAVNNTVSKPNDQDVTMYDSNDTPSSPPASPSDISVFSSKTNSNLSYAKLALQTSDPIILKNCINKFNTTQTTDSLRYFWPKWHSYASKLVSSLGNELNLTLLSMNAFKMNNFNDMDYFYVTYAKINQLIQIRKFECALKLYNAYEATFNSNAKIVRLLSNQYLYLNIQRFLTVGYYACNVNNRSNNKYLNTDSLLKSCRNFLASCKNDTEIPIEIFMSVLAFILTIGDFGTLLTNEYNFLGSMAPKKGHFNSANFALVSALFNFGRYLSRVCQELGKVDKNVMRKIARELWDFIIELFSDTYPAKSRQETGGGSGGGGGTSSNSSNSNMTFDASNMSILFSAGASSASQAPASTPAVPTKDHQLQITNRELVRKLVLLTRHKSVRNILISLLSTVFNIADSQANHEIYNEYRFLWPSSLANAGSLNLNSLTDLLQLLLVDSINNGGQFNASWLRTYADIQLAKTLNCDAIKYFLQIFIVETRYFLSRTRSLMFKNLKQKADHDVYGSAEDKYMDEKLIRFMIKSCIALNKCTQAGLLCQFLSNNNEYTNAFRYFQEGSIVYPSLDEMDSLFSCIWDMAILEYLVNLNNSRGFLNKRNWCLKLIAMQNLNASNPNEVYQKTVEFKKSALMLKLIQYYLIN